MRRGAAVAISVKQYARRNLFTARSIKLGLFNASSAVLLNASCVFTVQSKFMSFPSSFMHILIISALNYSSIKYTATKIVVVLGRKTAQQMEILSISADK